MINNQEEINVNSIPESAARIEVFNLLYDYGFDDFLEILKWLLKHNKSFRDNHFYTGVTDSVNECGFITDKQKRAIIQLILNFKGVKYVLTNQQFKNYLATLDEEIEWEDLNAIEGEPSLPIEESNFLLYNDVPPF